MPEVRVGQTVQDRRQSRSRQGRRQGMRVWSQVGCLNCRGCCCRRSGCNPHSGSLRRYHRPQIRQSVVSFWRLPESRAPRAQTLAASLQFEPAAEAPALMRTKVSFGCCRDSRTRKGRLSDCSGDTHACRHISGFCRQLPSPAPCAAKAGPPPQPGSTILQCSAAMFTLHS